jgi:hypothetical protein
MFLLQSNIRPNTKTTKYYDRFGKNARKQDKLARKSGKGGR